MSPVLFGVICLAAMLFLMLIGVNIGTSMGIVAFFGTIYMLTFDGAMMKAGVVPFVTINSYTYAVLPLFMLMANVIAHTGVGHDLFELFYRLLGKQRGGLAISTILSCGVFSAISSSNQATALTIGYIAYPEMKQHNYHDKLAGGSIASGGSLGILIPPSGTLMIYGMVAQISITSLFIAGIIPGLVLICLFCIATVVMCKINPTWGPAGEKFTAKEVFKALFKCIDIIILIVFVIGGMLIGWFTATEAGAIGAVVAIIITALRRKLTRKSLYAAIAGTLKSTGMIFFALICSSLLSYLISLTKIPMALGNLLVGTHMSPTVVMILMILIYLVLGMFIDPFTMIILTMPIFVPIIQQMGINDIWFGVILVTVAQMGGLTPPVGMNVYVTKSLNKKMNVVDVFIGSMPYLACIILLIVLLFIIPSLVTWLPSLVN